jgi:tetratricopeptide (TPR) repeat protein
MRAGAVGNLFGAQGVVKKTRRARLLAGAAIGVLMACAPLAIFAVARLAPPSDSEALRAEVTPVAAKQAPVKTPTKPKDIDSALTASEAKAAAKSKPKAAHEKAVASRVATPEAGKAAAEPKVPSVSSEDIPWRDRPSVDAGNCESLAGERPPGPVGYLLNRASQDAHAELIRGNTKGAHLAFCQAIQLGEPSAKMLMGLARVLLMQSDLAEALTTVERVLEQKPESVQALELKGDILIRSGRVDEARQLWVKAAGGSRASALLVQNLLKANRKGASSAMKAGDLQRAERLLRRAIAFEVQDQETCLKLVSVLEKQGELSAAKRWTVYADSLAS